MKKLLTASVFGAVFGLVVPVCAEPISIVSLDFFDNELSLKADIDDLQNLTLDLIEISDRFGTRPEEFDTVSDALVAIQVDVATAKELAEKAIPKVTAQGKNGLFVLTAEVVDDVATYRWETIDRATGEIITDPE